MVQCIFASCNNRTENFSGSFFRLPKALAKEWFIRAKRNDISFESLTPAAKVCAAHFAHWQLQTKLLSGGSIKNTVKFGELPYKDGETLPLHQSARQIRLARDSLQEANQFLARKSPFAKKKSTSSSVSVNQVF